MDEQIFDRTMAFAGILQALAQVQYVAKHGHAEDKLIAASLNTILATDPESVSQVYVDKETLQQGYRLIVTQLGDNQQRDGEITRYLIGVLALERKLARAANSMGMLAERINQVHRQLHHFCVTDEQVIGNFAGIYSDIISTLGPKIQVSGNPDFLKQVLVQQKIRALLLAAIRSTVLWRQLGGKRRQLIFYRKTIINVAKKSLAL